MEKGRHHRACRPLVGTDKCCRQAYCASPRGRENGPTPFTGHIARVQDTSNDRFYPRRSPTLCQALNEGPSAYLVRAHMFVREQKSGSESVSECVCVCVCECVWTRPKFSESIHAGVSQLAIEPSKWPYCIVVWKVNTHGIPPVETSRTLHPASPYNYAD